MAARKKPSTPKKPTRPLAGARETHRLLEEARTACERFQAERDQARVAVDVHDAQVKRYRQQAGALDERLTCMIEERDTALADARAWEDRCRDAVDIAHGLFNEITRLGRVVIYLHGASAGRGQTGLDIMPRDPRQLPGTPDAKLLDWNDERLVNIALALQRAQDARMEQQAGEGPDEGQPQILRTAGPA